MPTNSPNGTEVTGARVSYVDIDKKTRRVVNSGLAYDTIINAAGNEVDETNVDQLGDGGGISRLCSANFVQGGTFNFVDDIFFTGEEDSNSNGGPGGYEYALDAKEGVLYAVPAMGFAAWENVTPLDTGNPDKVALLVGDDREAAPLYLFIGTKDNSPGVGFLERNGLATGKMYAWKADSGETSPEQFNGTGESRTGTWVEITDLTSIANQDAEVASKDGFIFSRPEDVATDPDDPTRAVLASTGRGGRFPSDDWGTTYIVDVEFDGSGDPISAELVIVYDGDDAGDGQFPHPDYGLRSPDNLDWSKDGFIYLQEDRSTPPQRVRWHLGRRSFHVEARSRDGRTDPGRPDRSFGRTHRSGRHRSDGSGRLGEFRRDRRLRTVPHRARFAVAV